MNNRDKFEVRYYVVCLLDVLGQKDRLAGWTELPVDGSLTPTYRDALKKSAGTILDFKRHFETYFRDAAQRAMADYVNQLDPTQRLLYERYKSCQLGVQQFSDTFVFYAPLSNPSGDLSATAVFRILGASCFAMLISLAAETPVRGAIAIGTGIELGERNFYGPALADAHCLESEVSQYPRIVLSPQVDQFLLAVCANPQGSPIGRQMTALATRCRSILGTDADGRPIVDYMGEGARRILICSSATRKAVDLAHRFACKEADRFRVAGNAKLASRYESLRTYIELRLPYWK